MKKILLMLGLSALLCFEANANSVIVQNFLLYPITLELGGINPSGAHFGSTPITFPPGTTTFANPTLIPGASTTAAIDGRVVIITGYCTPEDISVGGPLVGSPTSQTLPAGNECNNGVSFGIYWNELTTAPYDVVIIIL